MTSIKASNSLIRITTVPISLEKLINGQMHFMAGHGFKVYMISSYHANSIALEKKEKSKYIAVNMTRTISPFKDFFSLIKMVLIFRKIKPAIVHTHTPKAGLIGMLAAWLTRVPIRLHTVAGLPLIESKGARRWLLEIVEKITYACASKVYPNSYSLKEFILNSKFCKIGKLKVIGNGSSNGINTDYFKLNASISQKAQHLRNEFSFADTNFVFIFIGRLVRDKGIEELVNAFSLLNDTYPHTRLLLIGPFEQELNPLSNNCLQQIKNNNAILTLGFQDDVRPFLAISHALVFPSYREGFPNVPLQAGCFDLPSIVTDINGCNEIIENEKNGLIVSVKNAEALKNAMKRMLTDKLLYLQLKANARKMIVGKYEQSSFWFLLLNEYQMHLKEHGILF